MAARPKTPEVCRSSAMRRKGSGVVERAAADGGGQIVAAVFALGADVARDPPDGGMIEEARFDDILQEIHQIVVPADVSQLVGQDRFELVRRQPGKQAGRHQHDGPQPADDHRHGCAGRAQQSDGCRDAKPHAESLEPRAPHWVFGGLALVPQSADHAPADSQSQGQQANAAGPEADNPGEPRLHRREQFVRGTPDSRAASGRRIVEFRRDLFRCII